MIELADPISQDFVKSVYKGLECCANGQMCHEVCPYENLNHGFLKCTGELCKDVLALLYIYKTNWDDLKEAVTKAKNCNAKMSLSDLCDLFLRMMNATELYCFLEEPVAFEPIEDYEYLSTTGDFFDEIQVTHWRCRACGCLIDQNDAYCKCCGRKIKWEKKQD